jgi:hypothetical protein
VRHALEQIAIGRRAEAEAEDARLADTVVDGAEDFGLVADVAVRS